MGKWPVDLSLGRSHHCLLLYAVAKRCREAKERHANYLIIEAGSEEISVAVAVPSYCCGLLNDHFCIHEACCKSWAYDKIFLDYLLFRWLVLLWRGFIIKIVKSNDWFSNYFFKYSKIVYLIIWNYWKCEWNTKLYNFSVMEKLIFLYIKWY